MTRRRLGALALAAFSALLAATAIVATPRPVVPGPPPVVVIVFDEFPTISLLDEHGRIDAVRYPNFARLARDANWFRYATASVDETGRAMESLLTGNMPERKRPVAYARNPRNLFTFLGAHGYAMHVSEEVTSLCPRRHCPGVRDQTRDSILHELAYGRPERLRSWTASIRNRRRPVLHFKHVLLPHVPLHYLPSGRRYSDRPHELLPGLTKAFRSRWPITQAYQRHLLQLGFTDRELGRVIDRLHDQRLYDRSLIVVTADNGESFGRLGNRHEISPANAIDIALTPLFVKVPYQHGGRVLSRHVRTLDVLPTIAHVTKLRLRRPVQGLSTLGPAARRIPTGVTMFQRSGGHVPLSSAALRRQGRAALTAKLRLFGSRDRPPGLYGIGPQPQLHGTAVPASLQTATGIKAKINDRDAWRRVRLLSGYVPSHVTGELVGPAAARARELAFAVNGVVAATAPVFTLSSRRAHHFSALVPEGLFHEGTNRLEMLLVTHAAGGLQLLRLPE